jgi:hypothetical protein
VVVYTAWREEAEPVAIPLLLRFTRLLRRSSPEEERYGLLGPRPLFGRLIGRWRPFTRSGIPEWGASEPPGPDFRRKWPRHLPCKRRGRRDPRGVRREAIYGPFRSVIGQTGRPGAGPPETFSPFRARSKFPCSGDRGSPQGKVAPVILHPAGKEAESCMT